MIGTVASRSNALGSRSTKFAVLEEALVELVPIIGVQSANHALCGAREFPLYITLSMQTLVSSHMAPYLVSAVLCHRTTRPGAKVFELRVMFVANMSF